MILGDDTRPGRNGNGGEKDELSDDELDNTSGGGEGDDAAPSDPGGGRADP